MSLLKRAQSVRSLACVAPVLLSLLPTLYAEHWPEWRGPDRNGITSEPNVPTHWSAESGVKWKTAAIGAGISSPVIWGNRIFLAASDGPRHSELHLLGLDFETGNEMWHLRFWGTAPTRCHGTKSTMASPTPITDGNAVFAFYGTGDVFAVDRDGALLWQRSLANDYGPFENRFAASSSPLLYQDLLLLQCDHYGDSYLIALDKATGKVRWRTERPDSWLSWASPRLVPVADGHEFVVAASLTIAGFDPRTGKQLWTVDGMQRECIPTPVLGHGLIYAVSGPGGATLAIKPGGRGNVSESHVVWKSSRGVPFVPSAILVDDLYYLVDDKGIGTCLDAHSGERRWQTRLPGRYTASPVAAAGNVYFVNESGTTVVMRAGTAAFTEVARNDIGEPVFASPAISQGRLFLRTSQNLYCISGAAGP